MIVVHNQIMELCNWWMEFRIQIMELGRMQIGLMMILPCWEKGQILKFIGIVYPNEIKNWNYKQWKTKTNWYNDCKFYFVVSNQLAVLIRYFTNIKRKIRWTTLFWSFTIKSMITKWFELYLYLQLSHNRFDPQSNEIWVYIFMKN